MKTDQYSILFSSLTGNTKKLADAIHETSPKNDCEYFGAIKTPVPSSELLYIGFWTDKGNADNETLTLLSTLKKTNGFFFSEQPVLVEVMHIFKRFSDRSGSPLIQAILLSENICVREKCRSLCGSCFVKMKEKNPEHPANLDALIKKF